MSEMQIAQLVYLLSQKQELAGPEVMLHMVACEALELHLRYRVRQLREELDKDEPDNGSSGSAQSDP